MVVTREAQRQARRPVSSAVQLETVAEAFRQVRGQARDLPTATPADRNFAEGYRHALEDFVREVDDRLGALARWRDVKAIDWLAEPAKEKEDDGLIPCAVCGRPLTVESAARAAKLWKFSLDHVNARQWVQEFWARGGAHSQARHEKVATA